MRLNTLLATLLCTGALCAGTTAYAQESNTDNAFALTGGASLAPVLDPFTLSLRTFDALDAAPDSVMSDPVALPSRPTVIDDRGSASALPWYERFTLAPSATRSVWTQPSDEFQLQAGDRWGVTLGYTAPARGDQGVDLEDFSAGAFIEFSDHFRFGGEVRFTSPEEQVFGEDGEDKAPEIRFESAFRF
ncbi:NtrZ family periplasmic regulatory protein [Oceanicaulis alexandrii]|uniref:NtrZ family periplasmic regulatory protein n=1 Tax=Oceanicaulis alexandrii TaxID=153233 RepID=UPI0035D0B2F7